MRVDAVDKVGGDVMVIQKYIAGGGRTSPMFSGELIVDLNADLSKFDIIHLTNVDRPAELYHYFRRAQKMCKPIVVSPIHHSYTEVQRFERQARAGAAGLVSGWFGFSALEIPKCIVRSVKYPALVQPLMKLIFQGTRAAQKIVLEGSAGILISTGKELEDIVHDIGPVDPVKVMRLRNGFDCFPETLDSGAMPARDLDVCVIARIEARKNQIAILSALNKLGRRGIFVGGENPNHASYCAEFKKRIARSNSEYLGGLPLARTIAIMRRAKVHVSASWFEVSSLVDIDAFNAGCRVVSSVSGGTQELLGARARYVDPGSPAELEEAIAAALKESEAPGAVDQPHPKPVLESWQSIAIRLAGIYGDLLERSNGSGAQNQ
jgi:glycosyltransferase involved in cell wall biosynthesis